MLELLLALPRYAKRFISVIADIAFLSISILFAAFITQSDVSAVLAKLVLPHHAVGL